MNAECVEFQGYIGPKGYGVKYKAGRYHPAHRVAWEETNGHIPTGLCVLHHCDNRSCIRTAEPSHLWLGTPQENMADMVSKGRAAKGEKQGLSKLTGPEVLVIRDVVGFNNSQIARIFGVHPSTIWLIRARQTWKHV